VRETDVWRLLISQIVPFILYKFAI